MSGIFGIIHRDGGLVDPTDLERIRDTMAHRGPDGSHVWHSGSVGLGQLTLHSTPESLHEKLPWQDPESGLVITADARIDNRDELSSLLRKDLSRLKPLLQNTGVSDQGFVGEASVAFSQSLAGTGWAAFPDSLFILAAYLHWGENCVDHLLGDFAFAIWDPRKQRLFCARDQMGARPFCYVLLEHLFAFASEPEALLPFEGISREPNEALIATIFLPAFENRHDDRTWHRDVFALMPSHVLTIGKDRALDKRRYWNFEADGTAYYSSDADCLDHFLEVFGEAVACRLRAPSDMAIMLSGGVDSASVAAMARRLVDKGGAIRLHSYSAIDDDREASTESAAIMKLVKGLETIPHFAAIPSLRDSISIDDLADAAWRHAHPVDNMLLIQRMMCLLASRNGNPVMLQGASGDVTMKLPESYTSEFLRKGQFLEAWRECTAASLNHVYLRGNSPVQLYKRALWRAFTPVFLKKQRLRLKRKASAGLATDSVISREFYNRLRLGERLESQYSEDEVAQLEEPRRSRMDRSLRHVLWGLAGLGRASAPYGVEVSDPWADPRVFRFFAELPMQHLVKQGWTKYLAREAFASDLDPKVIWRRDKEHLGWKFTKRIMDESTELVNYVMQDEMVMIEDYVNTQTARSLHDRWLADDDGAARDAVFEFVTMTLWIKGAKALS